MTVEIHPEWAPKAAERFGLLVDERFYDGGRFYRVVPGFVVQGGLNPDLAVNARWAERKIPDDPAGVSNRRGTVVLARTQHPDSATTQFFISDHAPLDDLGYRPFGCVSAGMDVVDAFYAEYGEVSPVGSGPSQKRVIQEGEAYLSEEVPLLDRILRARRPRRGRATRSSDRSGR